MNVGDGLGGFPYPLAGVAPEVKTQTVTFGLGLLGTIAKWADAESSDEEEGGGRAQTGNVQTADLLALMHRDRSQPLPGA